jgi:signal transduction histidine kinase/HAMP domain-containing protein
MFPLRVRRRFNLAAKFNLLTISLILLTSLVIVLFFTKMEMDHNHQDLLEHGRVIAEMVSQQCEYGVYAENREALLKVIESLDAETSVIYAAIFNQKNELLVSRPFRPSAKIPPALLSKDLSLTRPILHEELSDKQNGQGYVNFLALIVSAGQSESAEVFLIQGKEAQKKIIGYVQLGLTHATHQKRTNQFLLSVSMFTLFLILFGVAMTVVMTKRITSPIKKLAVAAHAISEGRLDHQIEIHARDELSDFAQSFNHMLEQLKAYRRQVEERTDDLTAANQQLLQEVSERQRAEDALQRVLDALEIRVLERTRTLVKTNEALQSEIAERERTQAALRTSEEEARRLAQENATMAEIGRIISSTLNIEEVYDRFAEEAHKLIPFDGISLNTVDPEKDTVTFSFTRGISVKGREPGSIFPLTGSVTAAVAQTRSPLIVPVEEGNEWMSRFPVLSLAYQAGLRTLMIVPLISKDEVIGTLHLRSTQRNIYSDRDLKMAESVASQIAGAVANAELFIERQRAEESLKQSEENARQLARENAAMAEIGRIISSTLHIEEVYEGFSEEVKKIIPFDRIVVNFIDPEKGAVRNVYMSGEQIQDRSAELTYPLEGSGNAEMVRTKSTLLIQTEDFDEYQDRFPMLLSTYQAGFRSIMNVPLFSKGKVIGGLLLRSRKPYAYTDKEVRLAERIGSQIAGAIANAQLYTELIDTENERVTLEEQFRQSQKMEAVGRLAGGVAHDFNNILTIIKGYGQLCLMKSPEKHSPEEDIAEILKAADRAADLTRQLLAFSRRQVMEMKVLDLNSLLMNLEKMLRRIIGEDVVLAMNLAGNLGRIKADPGQIEQVIINLAVNARDAMLSGGRLTIETADIVLDDDYVRSHVGMNPGHYVWLAVSDTGTGMTPEVKERVFEPFFTTKENGKGTGLGLSMVYGIVKQSGGNVSVYSEPGHGSVFKIYLPRVEEEAIALVRRDEAGPMPRGDETVLLVEDELSVRDLAARILRRQGYKVLEASDGNEAFLLAQNHSGKNIHLMITDVVMPRMGGRELADRLKNVRSDMKVLFISGYTDDAIVHHGVLDPGIEFLQKPFSPTALAQKVREVLDNLRF